MSLYFIWDRKKAQRNLVKHGVSFEEAASVLRDTLSSTIPDVEHSLQEDRFVTLGVSMKQRLLVVVHCDQEDRIRIISAREATPREKRNYEEGK